jgi:hypothetical protein
MMGVRIPNPRLVPTITRPVARPAFRMNHLRAMEVLGTKCVIEIPNARNTPKMR